MKLPQFIPINGWRLWLAMFLLTFLLFGNTLPHGYNLDDEFVTKNHPFTSKGFAGIEEIFKSPYYSDDMGYSYEYRPVTHLSFAIEHQLFGEHPSISHFFNLVFYALSAGCVMFLIRGLFPSNGMAFSWLVTILFIAHPLHTEVVASIKNREELLSLLGGLLAALALIKHLKSGNIIWLILMVAALVAGLLAKLSVVSFVILLPLVASYQSASHNSFATVVFLCAGVLFGILINRLDVLLPTLPIVIGGLVISTYGLRIVYNASENDSFLKLVKLHFGKTTSNLTQIGMDWMQFGKINATSFFLLLFAVSLSVFGELHQFFWLTAFGATILIAHPLFLLRFHLLFSICGILIMILSVINFDDGAVGPTILYLGLLNLGIYRLSGMLKIPHLLVLQLVFTAALVFNSLLHEWEIYFFLPSILMVYIVHIPLIYSDQIKSRKASYVIAGFLAFFIFLELLFEPNPSYTSIIAVAMYVAIMCITLRPQWAKTLLIALFFVPVAPSALIVAWQFLNPEPITTITTSIALTEKTFGKTPKKISALDRPLTYSEFPLGFDATWNEKVATVSTVMGHYIKLTLIPYPQSFYYGYSYFTKVNLSNHWAIAALLVTVILFSVAIFFTYKQSPIGFGIWVFILSILVFSNLFEPVAGMAGDRLAYVSSLGYCILIGYLLITLYESQKSTASKKIVFGLIALVLISYSGISIARNNQWKDALTLMRHDIEHIPTSAQGHILLASNLMKASFEPEYTNESNQMQHEALEHFKKSAAIDPSYLNVWFDMGRTYRILGEPKLALSCFQESQKLDSTFYQATFNVASIAEELSDTSTAINYYSRCIQFNPGMLEAYTKLSFLYFRTRQFEQSIAINQKAIAYNPNWPDPYDNIARVFNAINEPEKAAPYIKKLQDLQ
jgi:tetratricopeptide (TPR) repeat protein